MDSIDDITKILERIVSLAMSSLEYARKIKFEVKGDEVIADLGECMTDYVTPLRVIQFMSHYAKLMYMFTKMSDDIAEILKEAGMSKENLAILSRIGDKYRLVRCFILKGYGNEYKAIKGVEKIIFKMENQA